MVPFPRPSIESTSSSTIKAKAKAKAKEKSRKEIASLKEQSNNLQAQVVTLSATLERLMAMLEHWKKNNMQLHKNKCN